jgi:hypothetical protein
MATVKENLIAAKALIDTPEKWGKGGYRDPFTGRLCAYGALGVAERGDARNYSEALAYRLRVAVPDRFHGRVAEYNDHPDTTHADIMALFDRAIAAQDGAS